MEATTDSNVVRFTLIQRLFHVLLMVSFLVQAATGLGRMTMETQWGQGILGLFGGYESAREIHIHVGLFMIFGFVVHALYLLMKIDWQRFPGSLFGPDSLVPRPKDVSQFFQHLAWMVGRRPHPDFDRWGYWEKFDYWAVFWGMFIIGTTGILMVFPFWATEYIPGWGLNVAFWVHRIEAMLAIAHIVIIHFFIGHLRKSHFPMDRAMFDGNASMVITRRERPAWISRLASENRLAGLSAPASTGGKRAAHLIVGYAAIAIGLYLLIGTAANALRIHW